MKCLYPNYNTDLVQVSVIYFHFLPLLPRCSVSHQALPSTSDQSSPVNKLSIYSLYVFIVSALKLTVQSFPVCVMRFPFTASCSCLRTLWSPWYSHSSWWWSLKANSNQERSPIPHLCSICCIAKCLFTKSSLMTMTTHWSSSWVSEDRTSLAQLESSYSWAYQATTGAT